MALITNKYLHELQAIYYEIGDRGIRIDYPKLISGRDKIKQMIQTELDIASQQWGCKVFIGAANAPDKSDTTAVNLNATAGERALLKKLQDIGYHVPKVTKKNTEGEYESNYSTGELALQKMLAENQFKHPAGDPAIRAILKVRELGKLLSSYFNARLIRRSSQSAEGFDYFFLSGYNVAGTITGRRSSKRHAFGFGNNAQNFPKHSKTAGLFRECLVPREGNIFLMVDQVMAEEWPVSALSYNLLALDELRNNIDRHSKLASAIFGERVPAKTDPDWDKAKHDMKRYLGKKVKHARNYGMKKKRMSESLAQEGFSISEAVCEMLLEKARQVDPSVDTVFHKYILDEASNHHKLVTPFGRERYILGARPNADNSSLLNELYAWIPQSTVGDNTGLTVHALESDDLSFGYIVQEGHDSIVQDIPCEVSEIMDHAEQIRRAFTRTIKFHNGIELVIPTEPEIGFDFDNTEVIEYGNEKSIREALDKLNEKRAKKLQEQAA